MSERLIGGNSVAGFGPNPFMAAMIAGEMPAAIKPDSMAVAAFSSCKNDPMIFTPDGPSRYPVQTTVLDR